MRPPFNRLPALLFLAFFAAGGCGSSTGGGIGGTGISQGIVTDLGSVVVNGIRFDTASADIQINGTTGQESDLRRGMVVTVSGTFDEATKRGIAETVTTDRLVRGPVGNVDQPSGAITIFGQDLGVTDDTFFENTTFATLSPGTIVEIHGISDGNGQAVATRIAALSAGVGFELRGRIKNVNTTLKTFELRRLIVDYSTANVGGTPPGGLADGQLARVTTTMVSDGVVVADTVQSRISELRLIPGQRLRLDGFITRAEDGESFVINDQVTVRFDIATTDFTPQGDGRPGIGARVLIVGFVDPQLGLFAEEIATLAPEPAGAQGRRR